LFRRHRAAGVPGASRKTFSAKSAGAQLSKRPVTGISTNFWKAVMTTVPATPATAPRPSMFAAVEPFLI